MNRHSETCKFYLNFYEKYQHKKFRPDKTPQHICCCKDDKFPHNEDEKFKIINEENESLDIPLYEEFNPGELVDN